MRLRKSTKRGATAASVAALLAAASLITASASVADSDEKTLTADPLATWQTDGIVWSIEYARGVVYVGGTFNKVRPPGAKPGQREVARKNFAAFDAVTGKLLSCAHRFTGAGNTVRALKATADGKMLYVGGSFAGAGKARAANAVALDTAGCSLRKDFRPKISSTVRAIDVTKGAVYLGGDFTAVNGRERSASRRSPAEVRCCRSRRRSRLRYVPSVLRPSTARSSSAATSSWSTKTWKPRSSPCTPERGRRWPSTRTGCRPGRS
ncbi:hypothetical protein [Streptomyces sp. NBC_00443]|uniref:hypothetical protein n=1 Tax=Streptomyces sp. NBC_00443 TaxID=2975743 RepID=UPI002E24B939